MNKLFVSVGLVMALILVPFSNTFAGPVMDRILKQGELVVGITGSQPPLNATTKKGEIIGMDADLANLIASGLGVKLRFTAMPFDQLLPSLEKDKIDLVISSMTMNLERNRTVAFVGPYYASGKGILTKTKTIEKMQGQNSLNAPDFAVAVLKDSTSQAFVEQTAPKAKLIKAKSYDEALDLLLKDQVDAIVADLPYCVFTAIRYRDQGLEAGESALSFEPLGIALKEDALLINWLENFIEIIKQNGMLKQVHARWFQDGSWIKDLK